MKEGRHGLWLFVIDKSALPDAPKTETPQSRRSKARPLPLGVGTGKPTSFTVQGDEAFLRSFSRD